MSCPDDLAYYQYRQLNPVWTADGKALIYPYRGADDDAERLVLHDLASNQQVPLTSGQAADEEGAPALRADGRMVAFCAGIWRTRMS